MEDDENPERNTFITDSCGFVARWRVDGAAGAAADDGKGAAGHAHDLSDVWAMARDGQLYDNWMAVIGSRQAENHPSSLSQGKQEERRLSVAVQGMPRLG